MPSHNRPNCHKTGLETFSLLINTTNKTFFLSEAIIRRACRVETSSAEASDDAANFTATFTTPCATTSAGCRLGPWPTSVKGFLASHEQGSEVANVCKLALPPLARKPMDLLKAMHGLLVGTDPSCHFLNLNLGIFEQVA